MDYGDELGDMDLDMDNLSLEDLKGQKTESLPTITELESLNAQSLDLEYSLPKIQKFQSHAPSHHLKKQA